MATDNSEATRVISDAVQATLNQFADSVRAGFDGFRTQLAQEQDARTQLAEQVQSLANTIEKADGRAPIEETLQELAEVHRRMDTANADAVTRQQEADDRVARVVHDVRSSLPAIIENVVMPAIRPTNNRQDEVERDLKNLRTSLEKFDSQADRMASHVVEITTSLTERVDSSVSGMNRDVEQRVGDVEHRIAEVLAAASTGDVEVRAAVAKQIDEVEDRVNNSVMTTEARINDEVGRRIADIDTYIGRVSVGLDESITVLNDRIGGIDSRFGTYDEKLDARVKAIQDVDAEAIDDMKDRVRSIAGEAELVRIEMERFKASMDETVDKATMRLTKVETQLQNESLDTETAVQLDRLEEVERALIALDPSHFVRVDGTHDTRAFVGGYGATAEPLKHAATVDFATEFKLPPLTDPVSFANGPLTDPVPFANGPQPSRLNESVRPAGERPAVNEES
jgi:hypothetical protein